MNGFLLRPKGSKSCFAAGFHPDRLDERTTFTQTH